MSLPSPPSTIPPWADLDDQARLEIADLVRDGGRLAFTTDAYVVDPIVFSGGDIGNLAVCGTVNDLRRWRRDAAVALAAAFIIEEGFSISTCETIAASMRTAADLAGVAIATGDTKVVGRGSADKLSTSLPRALASFPRASTSPRAIRPGDRVLVNGRIGEHGLPPSSQHVAISS